MSKHKHIDKICCIAVACALLLTVLFMNGEAIGIRKANTVIGYESRLFNIGQVHTIDIVMDDWDSFIDTCQSEEYSSCSVVIDGEAYSNVGIRGKGNTSLSSVSTMDSERYSFKIEFDQYDSAKSYYGLDKLSLNNLIQDNTYMKDYLAYRMMGEFGVDAPLCSYVYITVNGEDWGLYLAVEGVEEAFLRRNYGSDYGELYKPDSMSFGGGRGNGMDFDFDDFDFSFGSDEENGREEEDNQTPQNDSAPMPESFDPSELFGGQMPQGFDPSQSFGGQMPQGGMGNMPDMSGQMPEGFDPSQSFGGQMPQGGTASVSEQAEETPEISASEFSSRPSGFGGFGMGSDDVKLKYIDSNPDSYSNIFNNAKTDVSDKDKARLIESLKILSEGEDIESVVDIDEVIRYFVVHNFVVNGDSYTGSMVHNYYLYEEDGKLSMIPWDYNLAYGTFQGGDSSGTVNDPIDSPVSGGTDDRPMIDWIFGSEEYTELYHRYFDEFISKYFETGFIDDMIAATTEMIAPYVEKDPTKFCTYEEFEKGAETIREFCSLRAESVRGQLDGSISSTESGQSASSSALVDASKISISAMGTMGGTKGGSFGGGRREDLDSTQIQSASNTTAVSGGDMPQAWGSFEGFPDGTLNGGRPSMGSFSSNSDATSHRSDRKNMFEDRIPNGTNGTNTLNAWVLVVISTAILAAGLLVVWKYRRYSN